MATTITEKELHAKLEELAAEIGIDTLETIGNDEADFHEISTHTIKCLLANAYIRGLADAQGGTKKLAEDRGEYQARICTREGWKVVGTAATLNEALAIAHDACAAEGLTAEFCASARKIN